MLGQRIEIIDTSVRYLLDVFRFLACVAFTFHSGTVFVLNLGLNWQSIAGGSGQGAENETSQAPSGMWNGHWRIRGGGQSGHAVWP